MSLHWRRVTAITVLLLATEAVYFRTSYLDGQSLIGVDYLAMHMGRLAFAEEALLGPKHFLPAWHPRELLGAPFRANLQSFPLIPTRLVLLFIDPALAYAIGVAIAAALAALFTYLYCRRRGLAEAASIAAGWTFACSGYFASRVLAGHLPVLEAYPALPLLLWLADRALDRDRANKTRVDLLTLAIATACVALAGHPQVPAYSLVVAALYVLFCGRGRERLRAISALALGVALTLAAWWPMLRLFARSTRSLPLAPPDNDITMPLRRLLALVSPGIDGWPAPISLSAVNPFHGPYSNAAYFWDTTSYIGLLPLVMIALIVTDWVRTRRLPDRRFVFVLAAGAGALGLSLHVLNPIWHLIPGTLLRSPARLLYISSFAASVALGLGITVVQRYAGPKSVAAFCIVGILLAGHAWDLGAFARLFVLTTALPTAETAPTWARELHDQRIAADSSLAPWYRDRFDDVGIFDSILLANPYRAVLGLSGAPKNLNIQVIDGALLRVNALQAAGVAVVLTERARPDLQLVEKSPRRAVYRVPDPWPRVSFYAHSQAEFVAADEELNRFLAAPRREMLLLPLEARAMLASNTANSTKQALAQYARPSSDVIRVDADLPDNGFVHVLESDDPGWTAKVDGNNVPVLLANGFTIAVPATAGKHSIQLRYHTPGSTLGWILSGISGALLAMLVWKSR